MRFRIFSIFAFLFCLFFLLPRIAQAATPLDDDTEFVKQVYQDFLNREADQGGLDYWTTQLNTGALTRAEVVENYLLSTEFGQTISPVARLYFAYFLRIPDYGGLMYWIDQSKQGLSLVAISEFFASSEEFTQRYGSLTNSDFVTLVYQNVLGRDPESGGLNFWTNELDSGLRTRGEVMVGFSESSEYQALMSEEIYVTMTYIGLLRRAPEQGGFDYWVGVMTGGASGLALIDGFLASSEYAYRFIPQGTITEYLDLAFAAWADAKIIDPDTGDSDIDTNKFLAAVDNFLVAKSLIGFDATATQPDIDQALFFGALANFAKLADPYSDMTDNGLADLGDFLDAFGIDPNSRQTFGAIHIENCTVDPTTFQETCELVTLDPDSPTFGEVLEGLRENMIPRLQGVIDDMGQVSSEFNCRRFLPGDPSETEFDYADVLFFKGVAQAMIAQLDILLSYDLDVDIDNEVDLAQNGEPQGGHFDAFLDRNPNAGSLKDGYSTYLSDAKTMLSSASDSMTSAVMQMQQEIGPDYANPVDNQQDEFINLNQESCYYNEYYSYVCGYDPIQTQDSLAEMLGNLSDFKAALTSTVTIDNIDVDFFKFFNGIDLRDQMPSYDSSTELYGMFPDPSLGGIIDPVQLDINEDIDGDNAPDLLNDYTYFFTDLLLPDGAQESHIYSYIYWESGYCSETFVFSMDGTVNYSWNMYDYSSGSSGSSSGLLGTWYIDQTSGNLFVQFAVPITSWSTGGAINNLSIDLVSARKTGWYNSMKIQEDHLLNETTVLDSPKAGKWSIYP